MLTAKQRQNEKAAIQALIANARALEDEAEIRDRTLKDDEEFFRSGRNVASIDNRGRLRFKYIDGGAYDLPTFESADVPALVAGILARFPEATPKGDGA